MEDKRGDKRTRSPSKEGSLSPSGAPTPPSTPSRSPPPLGSLLEVSSRRPRSPVCEQGDSSMMAPVVDLSSSSDEEGLIPNTLRDEEFARRLFGDLNHYILGSSGDGNVIIHNDFDEEEEEEHEEDAANIKAVPSSAAGIPASTTSATDADEDLKGMQDDNSDDLAPD
jgi:hypothetical protein